ncbi:MAG: amino acid ABC transporter permease [Lachnospiraceae bacterium]|nr:amino acid ABC transporter permease [Lachnospiraceae bacterium]
MSYTSLILKILDGAGASFIIFFTTLLFSLPLGILIMFARMSKVKPLSAVTRFIISILRGTPLMLQLIVWFFGPYYIFGLKLNYSWRIVSIILGFSINYAAYFAEIYRSGLISIPISQYEAATVLGYTKSQTFIKIIFPQMVKRVLPAVTNEIITLIKDTSLAFVVAYAEMFTIAKQVAAKETTIVPLFIAGLFYYIFNYIVAFAMERIEKAFDYYR